jgi:hypothetical protein
MDLAYINFETVGLSLSVKSDVLNAWLNPIVGEPFEMHILEHKTEHQGPHVFYLTLFAIV